MAEGFVLLVIGMVTVFAFLQLMVFVMNLSAGFFVKFASRFPEENKAGEAKTPAAADFTEIAVAVAAVKALR